MLLCICLTTTDSSAACTASYVSTDNGDPTSQLLSDEERCSQATTDATYTILKRTRLCYWGMTSRYANRLTMYTSLSNTHHRCGNTNTLALPVSDPTKAQQQHRYHTPTELLCLHCASNITPFTVCHATLISHFLTRTCVCACRYTNQDLHQATRSSHITSPGLLFHTLWCQSNQGCPLLHVVMCDTRQPHSRQRQGEGNFCSCYQHTEWYPTYDIGMQLRGMSCKSTQPNQLPDSRVSCHISQSRMLRTHQPTAV